MKRLCLKPKCMQGSSLGIWRRQCCGTIYCGEGVVLINLWSYQTVTCIPTGLKAGRGSLLNHASPAQRLIHEAGPAARHD